MNVSEVPKRICVQHPRENNLITRLASRNLEMVASFYVSMQLHYREIETLTKTANKRKYRSYADFCPADVVLLIKIFYLTFSFFMFETYKQLETTCYVVTSTGVLPRVVRNERS